MRIYRYKNATVYITNPTEDHLKRIRKATEIFLKKVVKEKIQNGHREYRQRISSGNSRTRKRN